jgi:hypothetical protein
MGNPARPSGRRVLVVHRGERQDPPGFWGQGGRASGERLGHRVGEASLAVVEALAALAVHTPAEFGSANKCRNRVGKPMQSLKPPFVCRLQTSKLVDWRLQTRKKTWFCMHRRCIRCGTQFGPRFGGGRGWQGQVGEGTASLPRARACRAPPASDRPDCAIMAHGSGGHRGPMDGTKWHSRAVVRGLGSVCREGRAPPSRRPRIPGR